MSFSQSCEWDYYKYLNNTKSMEDNKHDDNLSYFEAQEKISELRKRMENVSSEEEDKLTSEQNPPHENSVKSLRSFFSAAKNRIYYVWRVLRNKDDF